MGQVRGRLRYTASLERAAVGREYVQAAPGDAKSQGQPRAVQVLLLQFRLQRTDAHPRSAERMVCKFWLDPLELANNQGFSARELNGIRQLIQANLSRIKGAWYEHCNQP